MLCGFFSGAMHRLCDLCALCGFKSFASSESERVTHGISDRRLALRRYRNRPLDGVSVDFGVFLRRRLEDFPIGSAQRCSTTRMSTASSSFWLRSSICQVSSTTLSLTRLKSSCLRSPTRSNALPMVRLTSSPLGVWPMVSSPIRVGSHRHRADTCAPHRPAVERQARSLCRC